MKKLLICLFIIMPSATFADTFDISVSGYQSEVGEHKAENDVQDIVVISLHGKEKGRTHEGNIAFAEELASNGFTTYTPQMPWYDYSAPVSTAYAVLDALIKKVSNGKKVVIAGHSQGAPYALFYTTDHTPPPEVAATILLAPGHLIHRSHQIQRYTENSVAHAKELVRSGKGDQQEEFKDFNKGGGKRGKTVTTTAAIYLTYFDLDSSPNFLEHIKRARVPLLWIDGQDDKLSKRMGYKGIYATARNHRHNQYTTVSGGHVSMWSNASAPVIDWLHKLNI